MLTDLRIPRSAPRRAAEGEGESPEPLVRWLSAQLGIPAEAFVANARRPQTMTHHARWLATAQGLRGPVAAGLSLMIEVVAQAAWTTDRGQPMVAAVIAALRAGGIILPPAGDDPLPRESP